MAYFIEIKPLMSKKLCEQVCEWMQSGLVASRSMGVWVCMLLHPWLCAELVDERLKKRQVTLVNERKLTNKEDEVLEGRVQVQFLAKDDNFVEVSIVDMRVHTE